MYLATGKAVHRIGHYIYGQDLDAWEKRLQAGRSSRIAPPKKAAISDWSAEYRDKGVWRIAGQDIGQWAAFEDGTSPVQELEPGPTVTPIPLPLLKSGPARIAAGGATAWRTLKDCEVQIGGGSRTFGGGARIQIVDIVHCEWPYYQIEASDGQRYWVFPSSVEQ